MNAAAAGELDVYAGGKSVPLSDLLRDTSWAIVRADDISANRSIAAFATQKSTGESWIVILRPDQ